MPTLTVVCNARQFAADLQKYPEVTASVGKKLVNMVAGKLQMNISGRFSAATGKTQKGVRLYNLTGFEGKVIADFEIAVKEGAVRHDPAPYGAGNDDDDYAIFEEFGRKAGVAPPIFAMLRYMKDIGALTGDPKKDRRIAYAMAQSIAKKNLEPRHAFFTDSFASDPHKLNDEDQRIIDEGLVLIGEKIQNWWSGGDVEWL